MTTQLDEQTQEFLTVTIELHRELSAVRKTLCPRCCGMPWRRPLKKPCKCGEAFAPEEIKRNEYICRYPVYKERVSDTSARVTPI